MNTPVSLLRQYWNQWLQRRHPRGGSQLLTQNRVYIFLSPGGAVFCVMLLALLGGAINYDLALAYLLVFLLGAMALVSMFHTFRNLLGLTLGAGHTQPCFAGETARFEIIVQNDNALLRQNLRLRYGALPESTDVAPRDGSRVWLGLPAEQRGWLQVPRLRIETDWPLGIFRAWSYAWFDQRALVYPRPEAEPPALPMAELGEGEGEATRRGQDDFAGLRPFQRGDSPRHIAWKAAARDDTLMAKEFHGTAAPSLWLDWAQLDGRLPTEAALSRLTAWVLQAEAEGHVYGLRLPGHTLPPAQGAAHRDACLAALALFGEPAGAGVMSQERLDRGQQFALLAVLGGLLAPHLLRLPLWLTGLLALLFAWRGWLTRIQGRMPPKWLLLPITFALIIGVFFEYRTLLGRTGGVALLAALVGAKLLETRARRDALILVYLGYFLVLTNFLFDQSMTMAVYLGVMVLLVTTLLMGWHSKGGWTGRWRVAASQLRFAGVMFLQALPLMALLFVFFPRIEGPLWRLPQDRGQARSGLADSMSPGSFSDMSRDDEVAFRVSFEGRRPAQSQLYWRGPIFDDYDGRTWTQTPDLSQVEQPKPDPASEVRYAMMLEPHQRPWLLALDMPVSVPQGARFSSQYQLVSPRNLDKRRRIEITSALDYRVGVDESVVQRERALRLPDGFNPRARALAQGWLALPPPERINAALRLFGSQSLSYTLQPPLYGRDAVDQFVFEGKQGFCEHFAGAFVFMMRAAGVPARVVGGYQGGEDNDGYLIVRQADAHAWAEVWLEGEGWRRVDPTFEVAPSRIEQGLASAVDDAELPYLLRLDNNLVKRARLLLDSAVNNWNLWVVGYTPERQREVLRKLGIDSLASGGFVAWFLGSTGILIALLAAWLLWRMRPPRVDPARRLWDVYCRQFARHGLVPLPAEGPADFTLRLQTAFPAHREALEAALKSYLASRYAEAASLQVLAQQLRAVHIR